jgi:hypothetical protein
MILKCTQVNFVIGFTTYVYLKPAYLNLKFIIGTRGSCQSAVSFQMHLVVKYY